MIDARVLHCRRTMEGSHWQQLLSELWAGIFSLLRPDTLPLSLLTSGEAWYHQLPAVCRAFKIVFQRHPQLYCILRPRQLNVPSSSQLTALTKWCQSWCACMGGPWAHRSTVRARRPDPCNALSVASLSVVASNASSGKLHMSG